jgi:hypothetical protein
MITIAGRITIREYEGLGWVQSLCAELVEFNRSPIYLFFLQLIRKHMCTENTDLEEDSRQCDGILGIAARSAVRSAREEGNVRLVVRSIDVLAVPATGEINLRTDAARAGCWWELVVPDGLAVEV